MLQNKIATRQGGEVLDNEVLGSQLAKYRKLYRYTQEDIAKYLNIQRQTYSNYERGTRTPDLKTLMALAKLYRVQLDDFVTVRSDVVRDTVTDYLKKKDLEKGKKRTCTQMDLDFFDCYLDLPEQYRSHLRLDAELLRFKAKGIL